MKVVIIDGMGGGIGRAFAEEMAKHKLDIELICVGTNGVATNNMIRAGANIAATGENAIMCNAKEADIIVGPLGILIENSMYGEITKKMVSAISGSSAKKIIIPLSNEKIYIVGLEEYTLSEKIQQAVALCVKLV